MDEKASSSGKHRQNTQDKDLGDFSRAACLTPGVRSKVRCGYELVQPSPRVFLSMEVLPL